MASHEIELTQSQLDRKNGLNPGDKAVGNSNPHYDHHPPTPLSKDCSDSSLDPNDKDIQLDAAHVGCDEDEIRYHYLTFETELPQPTSLKSNRQDAPAPPEPPKLSKYTSPFLWSKLQKDIIIWLSVIATSFTAFSAGAYSPGLEQMTRHWGVSNVALLTGITTFTTGFGVAPMVLAPFSEINGRVSRVQPELHRYRG